MLCTMDLSLASVAVSSALNSPASAYVCAGSCSEEVSPSPKSQEKSIGSLPPVTVVVNSTSSGAAPSVAEAAMLRGAVGG